MLREIGPVVSRKFPDFLHFGIVLIEIQRILAIMYGKRSKRFFTWKERHREESIGCSIVHPSRAQETGERCL